MFIVQYQTSAAYDFQLSDPLSDASAGFSFSFAGADATTVTDGQLDDIAVAVQSAIQSVLTDLTEGTITRQEITTSIVTP